MSNMDLRAQVRPIRDRVRSRQDAAAAGLGLLMVAGVYLDGWAYIHRPGLETFFTPWHGVLYSAFALYALFVGGMVWRRFGARSDVWRRRLASVPLGYGIALIGIGVFAVGGGADLVWHQIFGVEAGVDALVSPTHLVLLAGGMLMVTAPGRAAALRVLRWTGTGGSRLHSRLPRWPPLAVLPELPVGVRQRAGGVSVDEPARRCARTRCRRTAHGDGSRELPAHERRDHGPAVGLRRLVAAVPVGVPTATVAVVAVLGAGLSEYRFVVPALATVAAVAVAEALSR